MATTLTAAPTTFIDGGDEQLHHCNKCGGDFPLAAMCKGRRSDRGGKLTIYPECLDCARTRKRATERRLRTFRLTGIPVPEPVEVPDDGGVLGLLRDMLAEDRAHGLTFFEVFEEDVDCALSGVPDAALWRDAILGTRSAWAASYCGIASGPSRDLLAA